MRTFEDFLMEQHSEQFTGSKSCMIDDCNDWLCDLEPEDYLEYGNMFAKEQSKGLISIKDIVDRENNTYKTAHDLGFKEGYKKGLIDGKKGVKNE